MTEIPESAIEAAADAIMSAGNCNDDEPERFEARTLARAALDAAAPLLAGETLRPLVKRHAPVKDHQWGGFYCGICWTKGGSRAVWPCSESLAIAAILSAAIPEVPR